MKVNRVEQHIISKSDKSYKLIDEMCFKSKNVYNYANYIIRQEFIRNNKWIRYNELAHIVKDSEPYRELGSNTGQQTLKILDRSWKGFFNGIKDWSKNKGKYLGKPKMPRYLDKDGRFILTLDNLKVKIENGLLRFAWKPMRDLNGIYKTKIHRKLMQVRFIPKVNHYVMEVVYETEVPEQTNEQERVVGIDIGIDNLATVSNNFNAKTFIINGKPMKSINQYYNKVKAEKQSNLKVRHGKNWSNKLQKLSDKRFNKIKDYIHKSSRKILDWCIENQVDTVVIGKNKNWKQEVSLGKRTNQNFVSIPFEMLISQLQYKCEDVGIKVIEVEESYTSGTSFLDEELPVKESYDKSRRIKRGLFKSNKGVIINADLNGSYQIIKKVVPNAFVDGIEGADSHPIRVNII